MSTWISSLGALRAGLWLAGLAALGGCMPDGQGPLRQISVAGGEVAIAGPAGYCVDTEASRPERRTPTVFLVSCALLASDDADRPPAARGPEALLSVSLSDRAERPPGTDALQVWAASARGRAAISRVGRADSLRILSAGVDREMLVLELRDSAPFPAGAVSERYWRGLFVLKGRVVSASIYLPQSMPEADQARRGPEVLAAFAEAIRAANRP
jgi:hypothetical protein